MTTPKLIEYERKCKRVIRPIVPQEMVRDLALKLNFSQYNSMSRALQVDCEERFLTVGRFWYLMRILGDFSPAISLLADEGFYVGKVGAMPDGNPEQRLMYVTAQLVQALCEARSPESDGGETITANELRAMTPLAQQLQALLAQLMTPQPDETGARRYRLAVKDGSIAIESEEEE